MTTALLGPFLWVRDGAWENQLTGVILALVLFACICSVLLRPRIWTAVLSILGIIGWLVVGIVGLGISV